MVESWQCVEGQAEHRRPAPHDRTCSFGRGTCLAADARYTSVDAWIGSEEHRGLLVAQQAMVDQFAAPCRLQATVTRNGAFPTCTSFVMNFGSGGGANACSSRATISSQVPSNDRGASLNL